MLFFLLLFDCHSIKEEECKLVKAIRVDIKAAAIPPNIISYRCGKYANYCA